MSSQSRRDPAQFVAASAAIPVLVGTVFIIVASTETDQGHRIITNGWFLGGLALVVLGALLSVLAAIMFFSPSFFEPIEVDVTPKQLTSNFENVTKEQGKDRVARYMGKRMRINGAIEDVSIYMRNRAIVTLQGRSPFSNDELHCHFSGGRNVARLKLKNRGDPISFTGRIAEVDRWGVRLQRCKLATRGSPGPAYEQAADTAAEQVRKDNLA